MHQPQEGAEVRWLRAQWARYYILRRLYLGGVRFARVLTNWVQGGVSRAATWLLQRTDPLPLFQQQREQFLIFYDRYEQLVDVLCWAARDTIHDGCNERYQQIRGWFLVNYSAVQKMLKPFIRQVMSEQDGNPNEDPFEKLFSSAHVMQVIEQDNGDLMRCIIATRDVIARFDAHLRAQIHKHQRRPEDRS